MGCDKPGRIDDEWMSPEDAYSSLLVEQFNVVLSFSNEEHLAPYARTCHAHARHSEPVGREYPASRFSDPTREDYLPPGAIATQFNQMWINTARVMFLSTFKDEMNTSISRGERWFARNLDIQAGESIGWGIANDSSRTVISNITAARFVYQNTDGRWHELTGFPVAKPSKIDATLVWAR